MTIEKGTEGERKITWPLFKSCLEWHFRSPHLHHLLSLSLILTHSLSLSSLLKPIFRRRMRYMTSWLLYQPARYQGLGVSPKRFYRGPWGSKPSPIYAGRPEISISVSRQNLRRFSVELHGVWWTKLRQRRGRRLPEDHSNDNEWCEMKSRTESWKILPPL